MQAPSSARLETALERLVRMLVEWGAVKIILFGSVARGDYSGASDIDLIVVKETDARLPQRIAEALEYCAQAGTPLPVEPLVYTPAEFARMSAEQNPLITEALRHGRILYDAT
jgi:predicted nucleotidyltransferase